MRHPRINRPASLRQRESNGPQRDSKDILNHHTTTRSVHKKADRLQQFTISSPGSEREEWAFFRGECKPAVAVIPPLMPTQ